MDTRHACSRVSILFRSVALVFVSTRSVFFFFQLPLLNTICSFFFFNDPPPPDIYPLPLHAPLPICAPDPLLLPGPYEGPRPPARTVARGAATVLLRVRRCPARRRRRRGYGLVGAVLRHQHRRLHP